MGKEVSKSKNNESLVNEESRHIITSREKIMNLRKEYSLSQADLSGDEMNRTLISYIENGKINLTRKTAEKIIKCVNEVFASRDIDRRIELKDIFVDYNEEVRCISLKYIATLESMIREKQSVWHEQIAEIEMFLYNKSIWYEKAQIFELIGDLINNDRAARREEAYTYYSKALELYEVVDCKDRLEALVIKIALERIESKEYAEAIKFITFIVEVNGSDSEKDDNGIGESYRIYQCWAKACFGLEQYNLAIEKYMIALKLIKNRQIEEKASLILELGSCYVMNGDFIVGNNCCKNALGRFEHNKNFNDYCNGMNKVLDSVLKSPGTSKEEKMFTLDQFSNDMEFALKYVDADYNELYMSYIMQSKVFLYLGRLELADTYVKKALVFIMEKERYYLIAEFVECAYEVIRALGLVDVFVDEQFLKVLSLCSIINEGLKDQVFALVSLLIEKGHYDKAYELIGRVLVCFRCNA